MGRCLLELQMHVYVFWIEEDIFVAIDLKEMPFGCIILPFSLSKNRGLKKLRNLNRSNRTLFYTVLHTMHGQFCFILSMFSCFLQHIMATLPIFLGGRSCKHIAFGLFLYGLLTSLTSLWWLLQMQIPFLVVVGWIMGRPMDLNFQLFETATLFMTVLVVAFMLQVCCWKNWRFYYFFYRILLHQWLIIEKNRSAVNVL